MPENELMETDYLRRRSLTRWSLKITIGTFISLLLTLIGCLVLAVYWHDSRRTLLGFSDELAGQVAATTREQIAGFLAAPEAAVGQIRRMVLNEALNVDDIEGMEAAFFSILQAQPRIAMVGWGDHQGNFLMVKRWPDGSLATRILSREGDQVQSLWRRRQPGSERRDFVLEVDEKDSYDPRHRPWYQVWQEPGRERDLVTWTDVYVFHADRLPGITASLPRFDATDKLQGVFAVDVALADLCDFLADLRIGDKGQALILDTGGRLIATRNAEDLVDMRPGPTGEPEPVLRLVSGALDPIVAALAASNEYTLAVDERFSAGSRFVYNHDHTHHLATLVPVPVGRRHWVIGVTVPEDDFLGEIKRNMLIAALTVAALIVIAIFIGLKFTNFLSGALRALARESDRIRRLDFRETAGTGSRFTEIDEVITAFERMKTGLRSFGRFVPRKLVHQLLERNIEPTLGGEKRELTILFTDIRRFTTISEEMGDRLPLKLGSYFMELAKTIEENSGTIDKTVGDSIIAMWNAPDPVDDHPLAACRAVGQAIDAIRLNEENWPDTTPFFTCFGLHTGEATVGHFGYEERLDYTCIGDAVNLAARLEQLNKYYGTQVLLSEATWLRVQDHCEARRLDCVAVKGKNQGVFIYEWLGEKGHVAPERLEKARRYEQGFALYLKRKFEEAAAVFHLLTQDAGDNDFAAKLMHRRCAAMILEPPPETWDGVYIMENK